MRFSIDEIIAGWFNVTFDFGQDVYCIMATNIFMTDSPAMLISMAVSALMEEGSFYSVLDNEPGAWVTELDNTGKFRIYLCRDELMGKPEIEKCELAFETDLDTAAFAEEIFNAFEPYSHGEGKAMYEAEWMKFPEEGFARLSQALGQNLQIKD